MIASGLGHVILSGADERACDPMPYLRQRKNRKFMGLQDDLAVVAAGRALASAGLAGAALGERAGLYLVVGYIPFEERDIADLVEHSLDADGALSMAVFSTIGFGSVSPLLTFRCLPNMPGFHVSTSFDLQGPYLTLYPGAAQVHAALEEAEHALACGTIDIALVLGVADQRNFLVAHHHARGAHPVALEHLADAAGCIVLEHEAHARARGQLPKAELVGHSVAYTPFDPFAGGPLEVQRLTLDGRTSEVALELGAASLPVLLSQAVAAGARGELVHRLSGRDAIEGQPGTSRTAIGMASESRWRLEGSPSGLRTRLT